MKFFKKSIFLTVFFLAILIAAAQVSADLCKDSDGYFKDCNSWILNSNNYQNTYTPSYNYPTTANYYNNYNNCMNDCTKLYRSSRYTSSQRDKCYNACKQTSTQVQKIETNQKIKDTNNYYRESYEYEYSDYITYDDYWRSDTSDIVIIDSREYEYQKPLKTKDTVVVYLPYQPTYTYQQPKQYSVDYYPVSQISKQGRYDNCYPYDYDYYNYRQYDSSYWRYKEPYQPSKYKDADYDEYYYSPRYSNCDGTFNWRY